MNSHRTCLDGSRWVLRLGAALAVAIPVAAAGAAECSGSAGYEEWRPYQFTGPTFVVERMRSKKLEDGSTQRVPVKVELKKWRWNEEDVVYMATKVGVRALYGEHDFYVCPEGKHLKKRVGSTMDEQSSIAPAKPTAILVR